MNVSNFVDIFRKYLEYNFEAKVSFVRGLVGLIEHGDSPQQAIAQNPRVAPTLVQLFYYRKPVVRQAGLQGVLAFSQNEILRPSMRDTNVIRCLSRLAVEFDTPDVQRDVILAFEALVRDDEIAKKAMAYTGYSGWDQDRGYFPLPERIKRQLESDPRFKSKVDEDTV
ncbi:hypothetical protein BD779DRAFT_623232 [Infundibulicybe gibba]|nr:hypothetical protein BD779DRAFT_623232 [Infundibulicybe gibba]